MIPNVVKAGQLMHESEMVEGGCAIGNSPNVVNELQLVQDSDTEIGPLAVLQGYAKAEKLPNVVKLESQLVHCT
jgi:hypothetical protein